MKGLIFIVLGAFFAFPQYLCAQEYNFNNKAVPDGWLGQKEYFEIDTLKQLHLNAPAGTKEAYVAWPLSGSKNQLWEFFLRYDFSASTTNYASFYLCSEQENFASSTNRAYYLKVGGVAGSADKIELIYQEGSSKTVVLESRAGIVGAGSVRIRMRVSRSSEGKWDLYTDESGGSNFIKEADGQHAAEYDFSYAGIRCIYSSTRKDKMYFDDVRVYEPFSLTGYSITDERSIILRFSKVIQTAAEPDIETILGDRYAVFVHANQIEIKTAAIIQPGTYSIAVRKLQSVDGDTLWNNILQVTRQPSYYAGQVRLTEWMSDPVPGYGLPEVEWVELFNTSDIAIDLSAFTLSDPSGKTILPQYRLQPASVVVVCGSGGCKQLGISNCIETSSMPGLSNTADSLFLSVADTLLIDYIHYALSELPDDYRKDGGYSMVRTQLPQECILTQEINFSNEQIGGSPGIISHFYKESHVVTAVAVEYVNETQVRLKLPVIGQFQHTSFQPSSMITSIQITASKFYTEASVYLSAPVEEGSVLTIQIDSIETCLQKSISLGTKVEIIRPKPIAKGDVFINEILYNAISGGVEFVELFNSTDAYIDLKNTHYIHLLEGVAAQHMAITEGLILSPKGYVALTTDTSRLAMQYQAAVIENCFERENFLSFSDNGGEVLFLNSRSDTLDHIEYGDHFQNPLNRDDEGISIEKIRPEQLTFAPSNWTSCAVGATPGYQNSQVLNRESVTTKVFYCNPCHATVNQNGHNDYVHLYLNPSIEGAFASVSIYTLTGELVNKVCVNQLLGASNTFNWYGQHQTSAALPDGIYVAVAEWWSPEGNTFTEKIAISTSQY